MKAAARVDAIGDWVGLVTTGAESTFVRLELKTADNGRGAGIDVPSRRVFGAKASRGTWRGRTFNYQFPVAGMNWNLRGRLEDGGLVGIHRSDRQHGTFRLDRVATLEPEDRPTAGVYELTDGRRIHFYFKPADATWDGEWYFLREADEVIRVYPLGGDRFVSDRGLPIKVSAAARIDEYLAEDVRFPSGDLTLSGTLLRRPTLDRAPAMVLLHGTFPAQRYFYRLYGDAFLDRGLAILVFDKRGFGASEGNPDSTIVERADDAEAAVSFLRAHPGIDPARVGVWAFSNSTWSLPVVGARLKDELAFLIAVGPAGVPMARAEVHRKIWELRQQGVPDAVLADVERAWTILYSYLAGGAWDDRWYVELPPLLERLNAAPELAGVTVPDFVNANPFLAAVPPRMPIDLIKKSLGGRAPDLSRDPAEDYEGVTCPVLFLIGAIDANIPAEESAAAVEAALERSGHRDHTVTVWPETGHMLNAVDSTAPEGEIGGLHSFRFSAGILEWMVGWAVDRVGALQ